MNATYNFLYQNGIIKKSGDNILIPSDKHYKIITPECLYRKYFEKRERFAHKGTFGHCLITAGSYNKAGACILSARAALKAGCGLLSLHIPKSLYTVIQTSIPEAMTETDSDNWVFTDCLDTQKYDALAIGPGLGQNEKTKDALFNCLSANKKPVVLDADALNLISQSGNVKKSLNPQTIITPHPKEFERLFGKFTSYKEKIYFIQHLSLETGAIIVLKGGITAVSLQTGDIYFNVCGNPGMATAGSGDVLCGIIAGILAQGIPCGQAAINGVYIHAEAGDKAKELFGEISMTASDIINNIHIITMSLQNM